MNLNDDVVYRRLWLWPLYQLHPGRSRGLIRYHNCFHRNCLLCRFSLWSNELSARKLIRNFVLPLLAVHGAMRGEPAHFTNLNRPTLAGAS